MKKPEEEEESKKTSSASAGLPTTKGTAQSAYRKEALK